MSHTLAASRLGRWSVTVAAVAAGALTLAASANATIYRPANSAAFRQAVLDANATPGFDKIILPNETPMSPSTNLTISDDLYVTGDHAFGAPNFQGASLDGGSVDNRNANFITVNPGVRFVFASATLTLGSSPGFATIFNNNGFVRIDNAAVIQNDSTALNMPQASPNGTAIITNSIFAENNGQAIV